MKQLTAAILVVLVVGGIALGQTKSAKPVEKALPDICKGVIDPYDISGEKALFYAAAGVDNELTAEEFNAAKGKDKTFVRKFDSWSTLITFDKDKNGKIDWNEAGAYRHETRRKVMGAFDANKDGKLDDKESAAADKKRAEREKLKAEFMKKYDKNGDGEIDDKERPQRWGGRGRRRGGPRHGGLRRDETKEE